ncbi:MAG: hypothetical protein ACK5JT_07405 [Hyphomicrobiaceae bacterium]
MSAGSSLPFATDRRALAAQMCHLLAHGAEDPKISLEQIGLVAREIADFILSDRQRPIAGDGPPHFHVINGGRND